MAKILSRDDFLKANQNLKRELVDLPQLGGAVYVRELTTRQKLEYNDHLQSRSNGRTEITPFESIQLLARMVSMCACDEAGNLLFTEDDVRSLADTNMEAMMALSEKAMELSGLSAGAIDEVKAEIKKAQGASLPTT